MTLHTFEFPKELWVDKRSDGSSDELRCLRVARIVYAAAQNTDRHHKKLFAVIRKSSRNVHVGVANQETSSGS